MLMATNEILLQLLTGGLLGMTGQVLRVVVGLKKLNDEATQKGLRTKDLLVTSTLLISLLIGFGAGILAVLSISTFGDGTALSKSNLFALLAAGYAGTDFIEGFMKKNVPDSPTGDNHAPAQDANLPPPGPGKQPAAH